MKHGLMVLVGRSVVSQSSRCEPSSVGGAVSECALEAKPH